MPQEPLVIPGQGSASEKTVDSVSTSGEAENVSRLLSPQEEDLGGQREDVSSTVTSSGVINSPEANKEMSSSTGSLAADKQQVLTLYYTMN